MLNSRSDKPGFLVSTTHYGFFLGWTFAQITNFNPQTNCAGFYGEVVSHITPEALAGISATCIAQTGLVWGGTLSILHLTPFPGVLTSLSFRESVLLPVPCQPSTSTRDLTSR